MHETHRVYGDKLVDDKDIDNFTKLQLDALKKNFEVFPKSFKKNTKFRNKFYFKLFISNRRLKKAHCSKSPTYTVISAKALVNPSTCLLPSGRL